MKLLLVHNCSASERFIPPRAQTLAAVAGHSVEICRYGSLPSRKLSSFDYVVVFLTKLPDGPLWPEPAKPPSEVCIVRPITLDAIDHANWLDLEVLDERMFRMNIPNREKKLLFGFGCLLIGMLGLHRLRAGSKD